MRTYIVKRVLLMIPTLFGISLVVFLVLNLAPGHPGGTKQGTDLASDIRGEKSQESHRIFREQFNLDKPILYNTLFSLDQNTIVKALRVRAQIKNATAAEQIAAQQNLEDYGPYAIPHLIEIVRERIDSTDENERKIRDVAVYFLRLNARRRLINPYAKNIDPLDKARNREIDLENTLLRELKYGLEEDESAKRAIMAGWLAWYEEHAGIRWPERPDADTCLSSLRILSGIEDGDVGQAEQALRKAGPALAPALVKIARDRRETDQLADRGIRDEAVRWLALVAPRSPEENAVDFIGKACNDRIRTERERLASLNFGSGDDLAKRAEVIGRWIHWYEENKAAFDALDTPSLNAVQADLEVVAGLTGADPNLRFEAEARLEGWGRGAVPRLIHIAASNRQPQTVHSAILRDAAVHGLNLNAPQANGEAFRYDSGATEERRRAIVDAWTAWEMEHRGGRWTWSTAEKARILIGETRFATYMGNLLQFPPDFGVSLVTKVPVMETLLTKLKYSISLSIGSILIAYLISIPMGIYSAVYKDAIEDRFLTLLLFMLYSLPSFFVATLLLFYFSGASDYESLRLFPTGGWRSPDYMDMTTAEQVGDILHHMILPLICLTYASFAALSRYMRTGLLDVIRSDYIRTARAKGLSEWVVIMKHAVRNSLLPILTLLAGLLPAVLGGSVIIEVIFNIPGMGSWMISSIFQRDYNVIMAVSLLSAVLVLIGILITDLSYALVDPRISYK